MSYSLAQVIIVASSGAGEDTFWTQILVLVVLAVAVGIGSLIKTRVDRLKEQQSYSEDIHSPDSRRRRQTKTLKELKDKSIGIFFKTTQPKTVVERPAEFGFGAQRVEWKPGKAGKRDLDSGMEMLEIDFLLSVIGKTEGDDENDVVMRKLSFNEMLRRGQLCVAGSNTLRVYAIDKGNLYGKNIQCAAMKELAERTGPHSGYGFEIRENLQGSAMGEPSSRLRLGLRSDKAAH